MMREVSIEIRRDTIRQHKHQLELLQSRNPLQGLAVLDPLQDSLIDNLIRRAIDSRVCWTMEDGPEAVEILRDVDVDVEVLEAFAFREAGKCLVGESGAGGTEVDVEGYGADGVSVEGVDDAEVVEEEGGTVKGEGLESVEEAAADEVDVDLAGELVEFGCFWMLVRYLIWGGAFVTVVCMTYPLRCWPSQDSRICRLSFWARWDLHHRRSPRWHARIS